jgi:uncharacterized protein (UPF0261 family)
MPKTILVIGTFDTKDDELTYLIGRIKAEGGAVLSMDVSVLGNPRHPAGISKHDVAAAAGTTIDALIALGEEGEAFEKMSAGAARMNPAILIKHGTAVASTAKAITRQLGGSPATANKIS